MGIAASILTAGTPSMAETPSTPAAPPTFVPYQYNTFGNIDQAILGLDSRDLQSRRNAVEWLAQNATPTGAPMYPSDAKTRTALKGRVDLVPKLIRALHEMYDMDTPAIASVLAAVGPSAKPALPAISDAIYRAQKGNDPNSSTDCTLAATDMAILCGGQEQLLHALAGFLNDPDADKRVSAVHGMVAVNNPAIMGSMTVPAGAVYDHFMVKSWSSSFQDIGVRALSASLTDPTKSVRVACAEALAGLDRYFYRQYEPVDWPSDYQQHKAVDWQPAVAPLARMATSDDPAEETAALKALSVIPADVSPAAPALRLGLDGNDDQRGYALIAIGHGAQTNPQAVVDVFLDGLTKPGVRKRTHLMNDIVLAAMPLWSGSAQPGDQAGWAGDVGLRPRNVVDPAMSQAHDRLLAAIVGAMSDPNHDVRVQAISALNEIHTFLASRQGIFPITVKGPVKDPGWDDLKKVEAAVDQASKILADIDPDNAKTLNTQTKFVVQF